MRRFTVLLLISAVVLMRLVADGVSLRPTALAQDATPPAGPVEFLWETRGDPDSPLGNPSHLAVAPDGSIWVADGDNHRFQIFAPDGSFLEAWGTPGSGEGEFDFTTFGWAATTRGRSPSPRTAPSTSPISATTASRSSARTGNFLTAWGSEGTEPGQFITPIDLVVDEQGRVYVVDSFRNISPAEPGPAPCRYSTPTGGSSPNGASAASNRGSWTDRSGSGSIPTARS